MEKLEGGFSMHRIHQIALAAIVAASLAAPVAAQQQNYSQVSQATFSGCRTACSRRAPTSSN